MVYHGVGGDAAAVVAYDSAMDDTTRPYIFKLYYQLPGTAPRFAQLRSALAAQKSVGRFPELSIEMTDGVIGTDSIIATTTQLDAAIDSLAKICKEYGGRIFIRPGYEFNGSWNGYHPYLYTGAFRKIVNRFRDAGAADSAAFVWCYYPGGSPDDFDAVDGRGARWYPGDDYVDWFAIDLFDAGDFDMLYPENDQNGITPRGRTERFLGMARDREKPVLISEASAAGVEITADTNDGMDDWYTWFDPFFEFMSAHPEIKGFCYINQNWGGNWGNARIEINPFILEMYLFEMQNEWYVHLPTATQPPPPPPAPSAPMLVSPAASSVIPDLDATLRWRRTTPIADRYWLEIGLDAAFAQSTIDSTLTDTAATRAGFVNGRTYWWRVRGRNNVGWGPFSETWSFTVDVEASGVDAIAGSSLALRGNTPEPFSGTTRIAFSLGAREHATLEVIDPMGRIVRTLIDAELDRGAHTALFDAGTLPAGIYFYRLITPSGGRHGVMHHVR